MFFDVFIKYSYTNGFLIKEFTSHFIRYLLFILYKYLFHISDFLVTVYPSIIGIFF